MSIIDILHYFSIYLSSFIAFIGRVWNIEYLTQLMAISAFLQSKFIKYFSYSKDQIVEDNIKYFNRGQAINQKKVYQSSIMMILTSNFCILIKLKQQHDCLEQKYKLQPKMIGIGNRQRKTRSQKHFGWKKQPQFIILVSERQLRRFKVHEDDVIGISRRFGSKVREMLIDEDNQSNDEIIKQGEQRSIQNLKKQLSKLRQSRRRTSLWKKRQSSTLISETRSYSLTSQ